MMQQVEGVFRMDKPRPTASPTSVLEDDPCAFMADWSWEASNTPLPPVSQPGTTSPVCSSPLRSSSSSEGAAMQHQQNNSRVESKASRSLVETLQNCLTSLPQSTAMGDRSMSDPSTRQPPSRSGGKRRPRASRRTPTKTIETEPSEFKDMVQKLTGIPVPTPAPPVGAGVPVRPRPQRANSIGPQTLRSIRRLPPMGPPLLPPSRLRPTSDPGKPNPFVRSCKREFDQTDSGGATFESSKRVMSAPLPPLTPSWWEQESSEHVTKSNPAFAMSTCSEPSSSSYSIDSQAKENLLNFSAIDTQWAPEEQEFNFDSWLSVDSSSTSSPCAF